MPTSAIFNSKRHDTGISLELIFTPPDSVTWDLEEAGLTAKFIARLPSASTPKVNATATVIGPWVIRYDPIAADVDTIGTYDVEVQATRSNGKKITLPTKGYLSWVIEPDLDDA